MTGIGAEFAVAAVLLPGKWLGIAYGWEVKNKFCFILLACGRTTFHFCSRKLPLLTYDFFSSYVTRRRGSGRVAWWPPGIQTKSSPHTWQEKKYQSLIHLFFQRPSYSNTTYCFSHLNDHGWLAPIGCASISKRQNFHWMQLPFPRVAIPAQVIVHFKSFQLAICSQIKVEKKIVKWNIQYLIPRKRTANRKIFKTYVPR